MTVPLKCFLDSLSSYRNKRVTVIELQNENEESVICYSQLRISKISLVKKSQTIAIDFFPHILLKK